METNDRNNFNQHFLEEKYLHFLADIECQYPNQMGFRIAETPIFLPRFLKEKLVEASEIIIDTIISDTFKELTQKAIPANLVVPHENGHSSFLAIDFAICTNHAGELEPQLIELQGFPSLFGFQAFLGEHFQKYYEIPEKKTPFFNGLDYQTYWQELEKLLIGNIPVEHTILLEIFPEQQKTRIDFEIIAQKTGISIVCYTKIQKEGRSLFYKKNGVKIKIKRIFNRLIFDDLNKYSNLNVAFALTDELDVEWIGHPNWFFRISKYALPLFNNPYIPQACFLSNYTSGLPSDLENYVLKPLFSFAGAGVQIHITPQDLATIPDPENYILQRKVMYQPIVKAIDGLVKCEIRLLYIWHRNQARPLLVTNLARLSRGEMIGVDFNKNYDWVGGTVCFMDQ